MRFYFKIIKYIPDKLRNSLLAFLQFKQYKKYHGKGSFKDFLRKLCILYNIYYNSSFNSNAKRITIFIDRVGILEANIIIKSLDYVNDSWRRKAPEILDDF